MLCGTEDLLISTVVLSLSQVTEVQGVKKRNKGIIDVFLNMKVCCVPACLRVPVRVCKRERGLD